MFFVMFEIVLVPMYFLIGGWGYGERVYAALKFFLFTMLGSAFMLVSILALAFLHQQGVGGDLTFDLVDDRREPGHRPGDGPLAVPRLRRRLRRQGAAVPACTPGCPTPTPRRRRRAR